MRISRPRNHFRLEPDARKVVLLAGGIGITPIKSMVHALQAADADFELHYCARDAGAAAFGDELAAMLGESRLRLHFDDGDPARGLDIAGLLDGVTWRDITRQTNQEFAEQMRPHGYPLS